MVDKEVSCVCRVTREPATSVVSGLVLHKKWDRLEGWGNGCREGWSLYRMQRGAGAQDGRVHQCITPPPPINSPGGINKSGLGGWTKGGIIERGELFDSVAVHQGSGQKHCPWCALDGLNLPECAAHFGYVGQDSKFEGWKTSCMTVMKQKFQIRMRMPCSNCLCTRGGIIQPFEIMTQRGESLGGGDHYGGNNFFQGGALGCSGGDGCIGCSDRCTGTSQRMDVWDAVRASVSGVPVRLFERPTHPDC